jgi:hypothetical protein
MQLELNRVLGASIQISVIKDGFEELTFLTYYLYSAPPYYLERAG